MRTKVLIVALLASLVAAIPTTAQASHSWGNYHWARTTNPFTVKLGDLVNSTWDPYLGTASSDWSQSTVLDTNKVAGTGMPKTCKPTSGMVNVCNAAYGFNGWLGVAQIWATGSHITQGTVKLNDSYFNSSTYNTPAWRNLVACQEIGHTLGLDHQDEIFDNANLGTCMDYTNAPSTNQHPNQHDYDQLVSIYTHFDNSTTVAATPTTSAGAVGNSASSWGRLVEGSRASGYSTYVRQDANGNVIVTHVLWA